MTPGLVIVWLLFGIASGLVAGAKGRSFGSFFVVGALLGPIGLLISLCAARAPQPTAMVGPTMPTPGVPGWLPDPLDSRYRRYWDGQVWTNYLDPPL